MESGDGEALKRLICDLCDEFEILVKVKDGQLRQLGRGAYEQVWDRRRSMLPYRRER